MRQVNIVGTSPASQPSRRIQTLPAPPDMAPANVTLRTASETSLWLRWMVNHNHLLLSLSIALSLACYELLPFSVSVCPAFAWMGIQWERRAGGLQNPVFPRELTGPRAHPRHRWSSGERVHHRGPGGVDRVRGQGPGRQRHRGGALEPAGPRPDQGVGWVRLIKTKIQTAQY